MAVCYNSRIVTDGLVLALDAGNSKSYPGSGTTWTDLSGKKNDGTIDGATHNSDGYFVFDGSNDYVESGVASDWTFLHNGASDFTIESWVYFSVTPSINPYSICATSGAGTDIGMSFKQTVSNNYLVCGIYNGSRAGATNFGSSTGALTQNKWNHAAFTFDSSSKTVTYYINGVSSGSSSQSSFSYSSSNPANALQIGRYVYNSGSITDGYYNGRISTVKIYKEKALTAAEVKQNFNALRGRYGI